MAIELSDEEFDLLYRSLRATVEQHVDDETERVVDLEDEAWELMQMKISADLVVLSACDTGRGKAADGEGLLGLTWALFVSGAHSAVVSQWRVESESTTDLMVGLHQRLRRGMAGDDALRGSILALMKNPNYRHPMYWAPFIYSGQ